MTFSTSESILNFWPLCGNVELFHYKLKHITKKQHFWCKKLRFTKRIVIFVLCGTQYIPVALVKLQERQTWRIKLDTGRETEQAEQVWNQFRRKILLNFVSILSRCCPTFFIPCDLSSLWFTVHVHDINIVNLEINYKKVHFMIDFVGWYWYLKEYNHVWKNAI